MYARSGIRRDRTLDDDDLRRATHEAGHVVVALALGWPVEYVTIDPTDEYPTFRGHVRYGRQLTRYSELQVWGATLLGGREAERQLLGGFGIGSLDDERLVMERIVAGYADDVSRNAVGRAVLELARTTIAARHALVAEVRDALLEHRSMSGVAVQALADGTPMDQSTR